MENGYKQAVKHQRIRNEVIDLGKIQGRISSLVPYLA